MNTCGECGSCVQRETCIYGAGQLFHEVRHTVARGRGSIQGHFRCRQCQRIINDDEQYGLIESTQPAQEVSPLGRSTGIYGALVSYGGERQKLSALLCN